MRLRFTALTMRLAVTAIAGSLWACSLELETIAYRDVPRADAQVQRDVVSDDGPSFDAPSNDGEVDAVTNDVRVDSPTLDTVIIDAIGGEAGTDAGIHTDAPLDRGTDVIINSDSATRCTTDFECPTSMFCCAGVCAPVCTTPTDAGPWVDSGLHNCPTPCGSTEICCAATGMCTVAAACADPCAGVVCTGLSVCCPGTGHCYAASCLGCCMP